MKFRISIPTKRYIKAYVEACYGKTPELTRDDIVGSKIIDLLVKKSKYYDYKAIVYETELTVILPLSSMKEDGCGLTKTCTRYFNSFMENEIKREMFLCLNILTGNGMKLKYAIQKYQDHFSFTEEDFSADTIMKAYHRYRKRNNMPYLREFSNKVRPIVSKTFPPSVLSFLTHKNLANARL